MKAIFFDRDGIVNRRRPEDYVKSWEEFEFLPDIFEALSSAHSLGYLAILVTNQRGIARNLMTDSELRDIHERMQEVLEQSAGGGFDRIYYCPHDRNEGCDCRKPLPGMLLQAAAELDLDLDSSWMIGDTESDVEAGIAAGCRAALVMESDAPTQAEIRAPSLAEAWRQVRAKIMAVTVRQES